jgi:16S rRNA C967 or C1407 C5-methylase (RsmB/RsmF family)
MIQQIGGLIVYSTCSVNPVENEASVAEILRRGRGALELVNVDAVCPGLHRRRGMYTWLVLDDKSKVLPLL